MPPNFLVQPPDCPAAWSANSPHRCAQRYRSPCPYRRSGAAVRRLPGHPVDRNRPTNRRPSRTTGGESTIQFVQAGMHSVVTLRLPAVANTGGAGRMIVGVAANRLSDASRKLFAGEHVRGNRPSRANRRAEANRRVGGRRLRRSEVCWCGGRHSAVPCARTALARSGPGGFGVGGLSDSAHAERASGKSLPLRYSCPNRTTNHIRRANRADRGAVRGIQGAVRDMPKSDWDSARCAAIGGASGSITPRS